MCDQFVDVLLLNGEVIRSQYHQPGSSQSGGVFLLVDSIQ